MAVCTSPNRQTNLKHWLWFIFLYFPGRKQCLLEEPRSAIGITRQSSESSGREHADRPATQSSQRVSTEYVFEDSSSTRNKARADVKTKTRVVCQHYRHVGQTRWLDRTGCYYRRSRHLLCRYPLTRSSVLRTRNSLRTLR